MFIFHFFYAYFVSFFFIVCLSWVVLLFLVLWFLMVDTVYIFYTEQYPELLRRVFREWGLNRYCLYESTTPWLVQRITIPASYFGAVLKLPYGLWFLALMMWFYYPGIFFVHTLEQVNYESRTIDRSAPVVVKDFVASIPTLVLEKPFGLKKNPTWKDYLRLNLLAFFYYPWLWWAVEARLYHDWFFRLSWRSPLRFMWPILSRSVGESVYFWSSSFFFAVRWGSYYVLQMVVAALFFRFLSLYLPIEEVYEWEKFFFVIFGCWALDAFEPLPVEFWTPLGTWGYDFY